MYEDLLSPKQYSGYKSCTSKLKLGDIVDITHKDRYMTYGLMARDLVVIGVRKFHNVTGVLLGNTIHCERMWGLDFANILYIYNRDPWQYNQIGYTLMSNVDKYRFGWHIYDVSKLEDGRIVKITRS